MSHSTYLRALASGDAPVVTEDLLQAADALDGGGADVADRVDKAKFAVSTARHQLARLLDYAVVHCDALTDKSPLATATFKAIAALDDSFPHETDMGTGQPLPAPAIKAQRATTENTGVVEDESAAPKAGAQK